MLARYWFLAARPKTLLAGVVPVMVGTALAYRFGAFVPVAAFLCLMFSLLSQIASNFGNDYYDFVKKTDDESRVGPARAVASGWISPEKMFRATFFTIFLACAFGMGLVYYGGWQLIAVGALCVVALLAYSAGPYPLSYNALGDLFVLVFFGIVAVVFSCYVQTGEFLCESFVCGVAVGLSATNILVVNNYRDYENDKKAGKRTTIVIFGRKFGACFYLMNGLLACVLSAYAIGGGYVALLPSMYLIPHFYLWRRLKLTEEGEALNKLLAQTSLNLFFLGLLLSAGLVLR
jgi:1,4-dihydroxy-2-naphthoate octaprenyltransferase